MPIPPPDSYLDRMRDFTLLESVLLFNRGISNPDQASSFILCADSLQDSPFLLPDMERALSRVHRALRSNERIAVYGDFDADGVCGTVVLVEGIRHLGGRVIPYIPHRFTEERGLSMLALERLLNQGVTLLITVDCGVGSVSEIELIQKKGMDVIVTDHHQPSLLLPPALAVVNPCRSDVHDPYPFHFLCGAGVAYKLMQALFDVMGSDDYLGYLVDLVAVATVADMVPLIGENRYLVTKGLRALNETTRLGLREMMRLSGCDQGKVDESKVAWLIGPRLNAPGRIDYAMSSYAVLTSTSSSEAARLALELERINSERQKLTEETLNKVKEQIISEDLDCPLLMVGGEDYHPGIVGLVAGRLVEERYRPTVVLTLGEDVSQGSARSISGFDIKQTLDSCSDLLLRYGGHPRAAGFTVPTTNVPALRERLIEIAKDRLSDIDLQPYLNIDVELGLHDLTSATFKTIQRLAPFGQDNPKPVLYSKGVRVMNCRGVGVNQDHLKLELVQGGEVRMAIGFGLGKRISEVNSNIDIAYHLVENHWNGQEMLELSLLDFAAAS